MDVPEIDPMHDYNNTALCDEKRVMSNVQNALCERLCEKEHIYVNMYMYRVYILHTATSVRQDATQHVWTILD